MQQDIYFFITHKQQQPLHLDQLKLRHISGDIDKLLNEAHHKNLQLQHFFDLEEAQSHLNQYLTLQQSQDDLAILQALTDLQSTTKSTRGGKRPGAGFKKGMKRGPQSQQHKDKRAQAMKGNQNATKQ